MLSNSVHSLKVSTFCRGLHSHSTSKSSQSSWKQCRLPQHRSKACQPASLGTDFHALPRKRRRSHVSQAVEPASEDWLLQEVNSPWLILLASLIFLSGSYAALRILLYDYVNRRNDDPEREEWTDQYSLFASESSKLDQQEQDNIAPWGPPAKAENDTFESFVESVAEGFVDFTEPGRVAARCTLEAIRVWKAQPFVLLIKYLLEQAVHTPSALATLYLCEGLQRSSQYTLSAAKDGDSMEAYWEKAVAFHCSLSGDLAQMEAEKHVFDLVDRREYIIIARLLRSEVDNMVNELEQA